MGDIHPTVQFNNDDRLDAVCSLTKALVLMMKESCGYKRWKRTLEICAYFYMTGFIDGAGIDGFKLGQCVDWDEIKNKELRSSNDY